MSVVFANNAATTLAAAITSTSATTITVTSSSSFPSLSGSEYFYATIDDGSNKEIVKITNVSSETWTVVRAQDGTSARTFANGVDVELRNNAAMLSDIKSFSAFTAAVTGTSGTFDSIVIGSTAITSTAAEINILDGVTSTTAELNILDGVTSTANELNILDGVTSTTAELNILDGVTSTTAEINLLDGSTANTVVNSKAVIYGSSGELAGTLSTAAQTNVTSLGTLTALTVDNIGIDGSTISNSSGDITLDASGDIILDADGDDIKIAEGGTTVMEIKHESSSIDFSLNTGNEDFKFKGIDDGSTITALTLDMSDAGAAFFNHNVGIGTSAVNTVASENTAVQIGDVSEAKSLLTLAGTTNGAIYFADSDSGAARYDGFLVYDHGDRALTLGSNGVEKARFTSAGFAIGTTTATATVTVSGNAVGTMITDNDGSFDMTAGNNFKCTPSGNFTLTFTNIISQSGNILLVNSGGHTVSAHTNSKVDANLLATVSTAGTYLISYFSDGTNVYLTNSAAYT